MVRETEDVEGYKAWVRGVMCKNWFTQPASSRPVPISENATCVIVVIIGDMSVVSVGRRVESQSTSSRREAD